MKKALMTLLFLIPTFITRCDVIYGPCLEGQALTVGDTWVSITEDITIRFDACDYRIDNLETMLCLELTFTLNPTSEFNLNEEYVYYYVVTDENIYSIVEKNIELNGYNIFDVMINEETQYTYYFEVALIDYFLDENGQLDYIDMATNCNIYAAIFDVTLEL